MTQRDGGLRQLVASLRQTVYNLKQRHQAGVIVIMFTPTTIQALKHLKSATVRDTLKLPRRKMRLSRHRRRLWLASLERH